METTITYKTKKIPVSKKDAFIIMWFVSEKLRSEKKDFHTLGNKGVVDVKIVNHIKEYFRSMDPEKYKEKIRHSKFLENCLDEQRIKEKDTIGREKPFVGFRDSFSDLRAHSKFDFLGGGENKEKNLSRAFLDIMCLYGQDCSFHNFKKNTLALSLTIGKKLQLIHTDMDIEYAKPVLDLINLLSTRSSTSSKSLNQQINKVVSEEILGVIEHINKDGLLLLRKNAYPSTLRDMIRDSDFGFGINVPKYDGFWETDIGLEIFALTKSLYNNLRSNDGIYKEIAVFNSNKKVLAKGSYQYRRILFIDGIGEDGKTPSEEAKKLITATVLARVRVMVIFTGGLNLAPEEIEELDACILRKDGCSFLIGTKFGSYNRHENITNSNEDFEGELHFQYGAARNFFDYHIKPILQNEEHKGWIYEVRKDYDKGDLDWIQLATEEIEDAINSMEQVFNTSNYGK